MKIVYNNSSIECLAAKIISRRILPGVFINLTEVGRCLTYKCSRNSEAEILKELEPKKPKISPKSYLDINTVIECDRLYIAVLREKPYKLHIIPYTGRHKAQHFETDVFTFAKITAQFDNIPKISDIDEEAK